MIVYKNKSFIKNSDHTNDDWIGNADFILDDNNEKDAEIEKKIIAMYPNFDFVFDGTKIIDVVAAEPQHEPEKPPMPPTNAELAAAIAELAEVIFNG